MLQQLIDWDKALFLKVNGFHTPLLDQFMLALSFKHSWLLYLPIIYLVYRKTNGKYIGTVVLATIATFAVCDLTAARIFKDNFERLRPCHEPSLSGLVNVVNACGGQYGFISNHACNHFGLAVLIGLIFKKYYPKFFPCFIVFATLVAYSRVYLGVHYPADVVVGAVVGSCFGLLLFKLFGFNAQKIRTA